MRLYCPYIDSEKDRINTFLNIADQWISSAAFTDILGIYHYKINQSHDFKSVLLELNDFVNESWDYRKIYANSDERWMIGENKFVADHREIIISAAKELGLIDHVDPQQEADYILPLGGARRANYDRIRKAVYVEKKQKRKIKAVVALGGMRPLNPVEIPHIQEYAGGAKTEYDVICGAIESLYSFENVEYVEAQNPENIHLSWELRKYRRTDAAPVYALAAPSSSPQRRADSYDTFRFFIEKFQLKKGESALLCTNSIYTTYQLVKFVKLAMENQLQIDCVGIELPGEHHITEPVTNYLQELKGTINALTDFLLWAETRI